MTGKVESFATIHPKRVTLKGVAGQKIKGSVRIIPKEKYPFKILGTRTKKGRNIRFNLEEVRNPDGAEYLLTVENLKQERGRYYDIIYLKTDSKAKSEIQINVSGNISGDKKKMKK